MPRKIKVAAVQMDAQCTPAPERLARAERLVAEAAAAGADLVALPEIFNTGYCYSDENYQRAEPLGGKTVAWMQMTAAGTAFIWQEVCCCAKETESSTPCCSSPLTGACGATTRPGRGAGSGLISAGGAA